MVSLALLRDSDKKRMTSEARKDERKALVLRALEHASQVRVSPTYVKVLRGLILKTDIDAKTTPTYNSGFKKLFTFSEFQKAILEVPISIPHGLHGSWVEN